ncbi:uncharacterized protein LOC124162669 [Ischnura elegans]|uniref:uncharacterized protein LOC124162669 n=1 Tax=Ischnura elegans TaxID=197161 RepID=UPI001ED89FAC|nr:uncharacterized protein LOC124162669 [Ischnura elegans]
MASPSSNNGNILNTRKPSRGTSSVYCAAAWCNNFGGCRVDEPLSFFRFPKETSKAKEWAKFCLREDLLWREGSLNNYRICSEHFKQEDYRQTYPRRLLKAEAIPSISHSCQKLAKDNNGNDEMCCDMEDSLKDRCDLKDIECDDLNKSTIDDNLEIVVGLSDDIDAPNDLTVRALRCWTSSDDTLVLNPSMSLRLDSSGSNQESFGEWDIDNNVKGDPNMDQDARMNNDATPSEMVSTCDEGGLSNCFEADSTDGLSAILSESAQENSLVMFFAKAFQVVCSLPEELQNQIKKDILESIVRAEKQHQTASNSLE